MRSRALLLGLIAAGVLGCAAQAAAQAPRRAPVTQAPTPDPDAPGEMRIALVNADFESTARTTHGAPDGWLTAQHAGEPSYTFRLDANAPRTGRHSARIDSIGVQPFGIMYQLLPGAAYVGKRLRFSAEMRTAAAGNDDSFSGAVLVLQAMQAGAPLAWERMADRPLRGDHPWQRHAVELTLPPGTQQVQVGVMLMGNGTVWLDDARLAIVGGP